MAKKQVDAEQLVDNLQNAKFGLSIQNIVAIVTVLSSLIAGWYTFTGRIDSLEEVVQGFAEASDIELVGQKLDTFEKDIDYENSHRNEVPSEKRLNCVSKNIGMFYNILLKSINAKKILEIGMSVGYSGLWFADAVMSSTQSDGQIITIDREKFKIDKATQN